MILKHRDRYRHTLHITISMFQTFGAILNIMAYLHYVKIRVKLVGFKGQKKIFCFLKTHFLSKNFATVYVTTA
jgi:hypothetical protein